MSQKYFEYEFSHDGNEYSVNYNREEDTYKIFEFSDVDYNKEVMSGSGFQDFITDNNYLEMSGMSLNPSDGEWEEDTYYITLEMFLDDYFHMRQAFRDMYVDSTNKS
jgi:hypothetical protein